MSAGNPIRENGKDDGEHMPNGDHSILVPLDGSAFAARALPTAIAIAKRSGARLQMVMVHAPIVAANADAVMVSADLDSKQREQDRDYMRGLEGKIEKTHGLQVDWEIVDGPVVDSLLAQIRRPGVEMVVMTTHGHGGLKRLWLGSVADSLVRRSTTPVLLVRAPGNGGRVDEGRPFRNILVPLDGSPLSESVLRSASELARVTGAHLTLFRVVVHAPSVVETGSSGPLYPIGMPIAYFEETEKEAAEYVRQKAADLSLSGIRVRTKVVASVRVAETILGGARASHADVIAMATHGRGGLNRLVLGSIADKVMRGATVSVLLFRPGQAL